MFNDMIRTRSNKKSRPSKSRSSATSISYQKLEPRRVLAGIFFDAATSTVTISGDSSDDVGRFELLNPTTHRATLRGVGTTDFAVGTVQEVIFIGFGGDDFFANVTGINSRLLGGNGNDTLRGGNGEDIINGGRGNDLLFGNGGNDRIVGSFGTDAIRGGDGNDRLFASADGGLIEGGLGDDVIFGSTDDDTLDGGLGSDQIFALAGDDTLTPGPFGSGAGDTDLLLGHDGDDRFLGGDNRFGDNGGLNIFFGGNGDDILRGGSGEDRLHGQAGDDLLMGGEGADFLFGNLGNDSISGSGGNDFIAPGQGDDNVFAGGGNDFIRVVGGDDFIDGNIGNDTVDYRFDVSNYTISRIEPNFEPNPRFRGSESHFTLEHVVDGIDTIFTTTETIRFNGVALRPSQTVTQTNSLDGFFDGASGTRNVEFTAADFRGGPTFVRDVDISISYAKSNDDAFVAENEAITPGPAFHNQTSFTITSPSGRTHTLISNTQGFGASITFNALSEEGFQDTVLFDANAAIPVDNDPQNPTAGVVRPDDTRNSLDIFIGESAIGTWSLTINDNGVSNGISFYEFSVIVSSDRDLRLSPGF